MYICVCVFFFCICGLPLSSTSPFLKTHSFLTSSQLCAMLSLGFTVAFSVFILAFINWSKLMNCHDEKSCQDLHHYVSTDHVGFSSLFGFSVMGKALLTDTHCSLQ